MTQQKITRRTALAGLTAVSALTVTACGGSAGGGDDGTSFSLMYSASNTLESPFETLANKFMEEHPEITIELNPVPNDTYGDTLRTQLQAGDAADVFQTDAGSGQTRSVIPLAEAGYLAPLGQETVDLIGEESEALFMVDGEAYAQPLTLGFMGLIVNKTAFDELGVSEFPSDWDGMLALCEEARADGRSAILVAGAAGPNMGMTAMNIAATRVYAKTPDWNQQRADGATTFAESEGWIDTMQTIIDLNEAGCFQDGAEGAGFDVLTNGLTTGQGLSFFAPAATATEVTQVAPDSEFVIQAFPPADAADGGFALMSPTYSMSLNADASESEAAKTFFAWLSEPAQANAFAEISGGLPVTGLEEYDFTGTPYEPVSDLITQADFAPLPNSEWENPAVYDALGTGVQGLLTGQQTVESVLASLDEAWDR